MKKLTYIFALLIFLSAAGCYHAPRTAWTPEKYKKKDYKMHRKRNGF